MRLLRLLSCCLVVCLLFAGSARADATLFLGMATEPASRSTRGFAVSAGVLVAGVEFEYSSTTEDRLEGAPSLRTGMMNVFLQTPVAFGGVRPYVTAGAGGYRERLGESRETDVGFNVGGGVKIGLFGPLGARVDYRRFSLSGDPISPTQHRLYAGLNLEF